MGAVFMKWDLSQMLADNGLRKQFIVQQVHLSAVKNKLPPRKGRQRWARDRSRLHARQRECGGAENLVHGKGKSLVISPAQQEPGIYLGAERKVQWRFRRQLEQRMQIERQLQLTRDADQPGENSSRAMRQPVRLLPVGD